MRDEPTAAKENVGLRPKAKLPSQKIYAKICARIV
jgi:hypothetical protein